MTTSIEDWEKSIAWSSHHLGQRLEDGTIKKETINSDKQ